jgi:hypothetical protein
VLGLLAQMLEASPPEVELIVNSESAPVRFSLTSVPARINEPFSSVMLPVDAIVAMPE